jgi:hypothetical protein
MPEIPNHIKKPLVKKYEEVGHEPKSAFEEATVVEVKEEAPVVKKEVVPSIPKRYRCKVRCWVSSKCQMFEPGDYATFEPGEFVPEHFELSE